MSKDYKYTDLNCILKAYPTGYLKWTDDKITELVNLIKSGTTDYIKLGKHFSVKETSVKNIVQELKRAARQGIHLEVYLKKGRPLRTGKKVLA
jgi:hypothetical protein